MKAKFLQAAAAFSIAMTGLAATPAEARHDYRPGDYYAQSYDSGYNRGYYDRRDYRDRRYYRSDYRCRGGDKTAGTVIGAVLGGLLGREITRGGGRYGQHSGTTGAIVGAGAGALAGREIAKNGRC